MHLTDVLLRMKKALPGGHIWRGKHRLYRKVTPLALDIKRQQFEIEEQNMFYLRHSYLTPEQSHGHANLFMHKKKFINKMRDIQLEWEDHKLLGDRFGFLKVSEKWE